MSTGEPGQRTAQPTIWEVEDKQVTVEGLDEARAAQVIRDAGYTPLPA